MTREEKEQTGKYVLQMARLLEDGCYQQEMLLKAVRIIDEALEQERTTKNDLAVDAVSRQEVLYLIADNDLSMGQVVRGIHALPSVTPQEPRCKDCKWWKDSDGEYRRGCRAESKCPINRREVFEGNGYCYMFEPQESEE